MVARAVEGWNVTLYGIAIMCITVGWWLTLWSLRQRTRLLQEAVRVLQDAIIHRDPKPVDPWEECARLTRGREETVARLAEAAERLSTEVEKLQAKEGIKAVKG